jgi:hypothetical protein
LSQTSASTRCDSRCACTSGVAPSSSVTTGCRR